MNQCELYLIALCGTPLLLFTWATWMEFKKLRAVTKLIEEAEERIRHYKELI